MSPLEYLVEFAGVLEPVHTSEEDCHPQKIHLGAICGW